ncbi:hypothetical protein FPQ18DRAFT_423140 [Pyronema domesticum]|uniref:Uncharacterized protein n=1 Tax=Pyronema omphalodes (strain CBS 100304) TaxID=1076935 RepID=U4LKA2_PYROM|nr:hypothetical protein FPQ18DRAFT_423140 [Pyronema domesticum]CCX32363.1 Protein of unknown function [Pyronema omphalodes CBS 100304]
MMRSAPATPRGSREFTPTTYDRPPISQAPISEAPISQAPTPSCGVCRTRASCISCRSCINCRSCPSCKECRRCHPKQVTDPNDVDFDNCTCSKRFGIEHLLSFWLDILAASFLLVHCFHFCGIPLLPFYILTSLSYCGQSIFLILRSRYLDEPHARPCQWPALLSWHWKYLLFDMAFLRYIPRFVTLMYITVGLKQENWFIIIIMLVMSFPLLPLDLLFIFDVRKRALRVAKEGGEYAFLPGDEFEVNEDGQKTEGDGGEEGQEKKEEKNRFVHRNNAMLACFIGLLLLVFCIWMMDENLKMSPSEDDSQEDLRVKGWLRDAATAYLQRFGPTEDGPGTKVVVDFVKM